MRSNNQVNLMLAALFAAALFASPPTLAQDADRQSECPGSEAQCDADDGGPGTEPVGFVAGYECGDIDLDSVRIEYGRVVAAFVGASAEADTVEAMLWLRDALNRQALWDDWHYRCADYSRRQLIQMTLDDDLAEQYAREYRKYFNVGPVPAADILGSAG